MKIVFLNAWNGKLEREILEFTARTDADVYCFQEAREPLQTRLDLVLPGYQKSATKKYFDKDANFDQATYVRGGIAVNSVQTVFDGDRHSGLCLCVEADVNGRTIQIGNFHGLPQPGGKLDNPDRLGQSRGLIEFFSRRPGIKVIGGDFNLRPDTESVRMFGRNGYRNLIDEYRVKTTRNRLSWNAHPGSMQYFADYVFVGGGAEIRGFSVPELEISDHLPMIVEVAI
jgi:endonuclease/exonuclease/phosphatase family metal-dependent hydrolase